MRQVHLILPFSRLHLADALVHAYESTGAILHPITFADEPVFPVEHSWIQPMVIPRNAPEPGLPAGIQKVNHFIRHALIEFEDYYVTVADDDAYAPGVLQAVAAMEAPVVVVSMKRGHRIPAGPVRPYDITTLVAEPGNMKIGQVSGEQLFVRGDIFRSYLFDATSPVCDGIVAEWIARDYGAAIAYRPDLFAWFNYYEPGRWDCLKISFGVLVNDPIRLDMCLRQSGVAGEMHFIKFPESATKGLNKLLDIMEADGADVAVLAHQDMYFAQAWIPQVRRQLDLLHESWTVAGIVGKDMQGRIAGRFWDTRIPLHFDTGNIHTFPVAACCFDECCLLVNVKTGFRFDETLEGFDLYGTLAVLQTWERGGTAWIIDAFAQHHCLRPFTWFPDEAFQRRFKWLHDRFLAQHEGRRLDTTVLGVPPEERIFATSA